MSNRSTNEAKDLAMDKKYEQIHDEIVRRKNDSRHVEEMLFEMVTSEKETMKNTIHHNEYSFKKKHSFKKIFNKFKRKDKKRQNI